MKKRGEEKVEIPIGTAESRKEKRVIFFDLGELTILIAFPVGFSLLGTICLDLPNA